MTVGSAPTSEATNKVACQSFQPQTWSSKDTAETVAQIKEHNAAGMEVCKWTPPPPKPKPAKSAGVTFKDRWHEGVKIQLTAFQ